MGRLCNSGKLSIGNSDNSTAYVEGMIYREGGSSIDSPLDGNPYPKNSSEYKAWEAGWIAADYQPNSDPNSRWCGMVCQCKHQYSIMKKQERLWLSGNGTQLLNQNRKPKRRQLMLNVRRPTPNP